jgi:8-amino-7-oxononanoate synthase
VPDFTGALYLGLRHPTCMLRPWAALTTGVPAAVRPVPGADAVAQRLARVQGCEAATLVPSTLHGAWDIGALVDARGDTLLCDAELYPILEAAASRAAARGVTVVRFSHGDVAALNRALRRGGRRPVVLIDGVCPACGGVAPLRAYVDAVRRRSGLLVIDDTQAIGILGSRGGAVPAWGHGGGGSLRFHGLAGAPDILVLASLAKGLGVPVAAVSGTRGAIDDYEAGSDTRVHCSPVSLADVNALDRALRVNSGYGEELRRRVARAVERMRCALRGIGIEPAGGSFPVQALPPLPRPDAERLHRCLRMADVHAVPQSWRNGAEGRLVFVLGADTTAADIATAVAVLARAPELALLRRAAPRRREAA